MDNKGRDYDFLFKLLLIGDSGVGKTSLLCSFAEDGVYNSTFSPTFGIDFKIKTVQCRDKRIKLQFWDTAGQERFRSVTSSYYRGAMGVLLVYSISDLTTFASVGRWLGAVEELASPGLPVMLVGNKADLATERQVAQVRGEEAARRHGLAFLETSARSGAGVRAAFLCLVEAILDREAAPAAGHLGPDTIGLQPAAGPDRSCRC
jgi:small GTP-binding protein